MTIELLHLPQFALIPLPHKVFYPKKKTRIENEDECKEEWSRNKKSKFTYTKQILKKSVKYLLVLRLVNV